MSSWVASYDILPAYSRLIATRKSDKGKFHNIRRTKCGNSLMHICSERNNRISCKLRNLNFSFLIIMIESQYGSIYCDGFFKDNRHCLLGSYRLIPFKLNGNQACTFYPNLFLHQRLFYLGTKQYLSGPFSRNYTGRFHGRPQYWWPVPDHITDIVEIISNAKHWFEFL